MGCAFLERLFEFFISGIKQKHLKPFLNIAECYEMRSVCRNFKIEHILHDSRETIWQMFIPQCI